MGRLTVLDGGWFTTLQDAGRSGYRRFGVPESGALDRIAYRQANRLVGNTGHEAVLECTLKGGAYVFHDDAYVAVTGADIPVSVDDKSAGMNQSFIIKAGQTLELGAVRKGCRVYVGIAGGLTVPQLFGSRSTLPAVGIGGHEGRPLKTGDELKWEEPLRQVQEQRLKTRELRYFSSRLTIPVYKGPEWEWLSSPARNTLFNQPFVIQSQSNRMGVRLKGESLLLTDKTEMRSSPVVPGTIQLPSGGHPIILLYDGQTTGGYPRIGRIAERDLPWIAQMPPGSILRFGQDFA
ncbi:MAG: biotin-dependent carboxyltransferase family protein [Bacteroidota bacterium]